MELFVDDFQAAPHRQEIVPGIRRAYVFGPLERMPRRLRLDPTEQAGVTVVLHRIELRSSDRELATLAPPDLAKWFCDGVSDVRHSVDSLTLRSRTDDPACISPALDVASSGGEWAASRIARVTGAGFILVAGAVALLVLRKRRDAGVRLHEPHLYVPLAPDVPARASFRRARSYLWVFSICYAVVAVSAVAADRHLYADGSAYLLYDILLGGHFVFPLRSFSYLYYQGPTLLAIAAGIRSVGFLSWLYGLVLFSPPLLGAWLSWWICRQADVRLAFFPVFCCLSVLLSWMFYPVTEVHLTVSAFWPLFCFALAWDPARAMRRSHFVAGGALLLFFGLSHDSAAVLAPALAGAAWWRARTIPAGSARRAVITMGVTAVLAALGHLVVNASSMLVSQSTFLSGLMEIGTNDLVLWNLFAFGCVLLCFVPGVRARGAGAAIAVLAGAALYVVFGFVTQNIAFKPWSHQLTRAGAPLFALLIAVSVAFLFRSRLWAAANWDHMWRLAGIAFVVGVVWQGFATSQWIVYRQIFTDELRRSTGLIEFEDTALASERSGRPNFRHMTFMWELPHQSIIWSPGEVRSILHNSRMPPLSKMIGRRDLPELAAFDRFVDPAIVP